MIEKNISKLTHQIPTPDKGENQAEIVKKVMSIRNIKT